MQPVPPVDESLLRPTNNLYGIYGAETGPYGITYRWTGKQATVTFPYAAYMGRNASIRVRMSVGGSPGSAPVRVTLLLNGKVATQVEVTHEYQVYTANLDTRTTPNPNLEAAHVQLDIIAPTFRSSADGRELGVAIDWIEVQPERSRLDILLEAGSWAAVVGVIMLVALVRLGRGWGIAMGAGTLLSFVALHLSYLPRGIPPVVEAMLAGLAWLVAACLAPRKGPAWGLALAWVGLWLVVAGRLLGEWQLDDAYISYRYAWNLTQGFGLVYNPGERVEGYTNFLWTVIASLPISLGISPAATTLTLTIAASIGLIGITWYMSAKLSKGAYSWCAVACVLVAIDSAVVTYGARGSGMESMLFAMLVMLAAVLLFGRGTRRTCIFAGVTLGLAFLTRPEGLLVAAIFIAVRALQEWRHKARARRSLLFTGVPFLVVVLPFEAWRILYYGYPLPNTFYAKTGVSLALVDRGWDRFVFFRADHWLLIALSAVGVALFVAGWRRSGVLAAFAVYSLLQVLYVLWIGDDHFPGWRFFVPIIAPLALMSQEVARRAVAFLPARGRVRVAVGVLLALAALVYASDTIWLQESQGVMAQLTGLHTAYVERWGSAGLWLKNNTPPSTTTAAKGAGAIAYYGRRTTVDMFGLTDLHIGHIEVPNMGVQNAGHDKTDPAYVLLTRKPAYILAEWSAYFDPLKDQLQALYKSESVLSPTGVPTSWLVQRK